MQSACNRHAISNILLLLHHHHHLLLLLAVTGSPWPPYEECNQHAIIIIISSILAVTGSPWP